MVAFERVAPAIRRTIALARTLPAPAAPAPQAVSTADRLVAARKKIIREVEDTIQRSDRKAQAELLQSELLERLDGPDLDEDLSHLPVATVTKNVCRDLGIAYHGETHPWKRRRPEDVAALCATAAWQARPGHGPIGSPAASRTGGEAPVSRVVGVGDATLTQAGSRHPRPAWRDTR